MPETDFELVKYERDREHELALNEYTHNLEVEQLKLLILLNGGAATAFLTFAEHAAASTSWLMLPVGLWLIGLCTGAAATFRMRTAQGKYSKFYRHRRQVTEYLRLAGRRKLPAVISRGDRRTLLTLARKDRALRRAVLARDAAAMHERLAETTFGEAQATNKGVATLGYVSLAAFLLGAIAAAFVLIMTSSPPESSFKVEVTAAPRR